MSEMKEAAKLNGYELIDEKARAEIAKLKEGGGKLYMHTIIISQTIVSGTETKYDTVKFVLYSTKPEKMTQAEILTYLYLQGILNGVYDYYTENSDPYLDDTPQHTVSVAADFAAIDTSGEDGYWGDFTVYGVDAYDGDLVAINEQFLIYSENSYSIFDVVKEV